ETGAAHTRLGVVGDEQLRAAAIEFEGIHLYLEPVLHLLVGGGFGVGVAGDAQCADEQRRLSEGAVGMVNRDGGAGPVEEQFLAGTVFLPQDYILLLLPTPVELAEPAVAVAVRMVFTVLLPKQLQSQLAMLLPFLTKGGKIRQGTFGRF